MNELNAIFNLYPPGYIIQFLGDVVLFSVAPWVTGNMPVTNKILVLLILIVAGFLVKIKSYDSYDSNNLSCMIQK